MEKEGEKEVSEDEKEENIGMRRRSLRLKLWEQMRTTVAKRRQRKPRR